MPAPLIPIIAGAAKVAAGIGARAAAGTAGRAVAGQVAKTVAGQTAQKAAYGVGRTASGKTLQATKPKKQWDWSNMAGNFAISNDGDFV